MNSPYRFVNVHTDPRRYPYSFEIYFPSCNQTLQVADVNILITNWHSLSSFHSHSIKVILILNRKRKQPFVRYSRQKNHVGTCKCNPWHTHDVQNPAKDKTYCFIFWTNTNVNNIRHLLRPNWRLKLVSFPRSRNRGQKINGSVINQHRRSPVGNRFVRTRRNGTILSHEQKLPTSRIVSVPNHSKPGYHIRSGRNWLKRRNWLTGPHRVIFQNC